MIWNQKLWSSSKHRYSGKLLEIIEKLDGQEAKVKTSLEAVNIFKPPFSIPKKTKISQTLVRYARDYQPKPLTGWTKHENI